MNTTQLEHAGHVWTYYASAAGAPGKRRGWYDETGRRATGNQAQWLAEQWQASR